MVIRVTDTRLLKLTGGIVQGMSGSPILQDDKIIGAVTHVFVEEPTKGYAVFMENMLDTWLIPCAGSKKQPAGYGRAGSIFPK